jgi:transposase
MRPQLSSISLVGSAASFAAPASGSGWMVHPPKAFEAWLAEGRDCGVRVVESFATSLDQDGAAVRAALTLPWSSGQAEGQINRLKLLKRAMYGRASLDLLRRRLILAA